MKSQKSNDKKQKDDLAEKNRVVLIHLGDREKSGHQIHTKLKQYNFNVDQFDVTDDFFEFSYELSPLAVIVNIGKVDFEYDYLLSELFDKDYKVIINEASRSNELVGLQRRSWERHLLNKIDPAISLFPAESEPLKKSFIDVKKFGIDEVWILAASIGGPEAIKEFICNLSKLDNKLYIIIQHMDKEFVASMVQQLSGITNKHIQVPISGQELSPMILIYPTDEAVSLDSRGNIELQAMNKQFKYVPCIDSAVKSLRGYFKELNIAVFSGMCDDGVIAAKLIKQNGGKVILQSEESCVLSTIVSGIKKQVEYDFEGNPKQLANYISKKMENKHVQ